MKKLIPAIMIVAIVALCASACAPEVVELQTQNVEWSAGDKFTCNLKGSVEHYVVVEVTLIVTGTEEEPGTIDQIMSDLTAFLDEQDSLIRDTIITVLRSVTEEDAVADDAQTIIEGKICDAVNKELRKESEDLDADIITGVLFSGFLVS
jgi:flagellar basal body-associated protein FliL